MPQMFPTQWPWRPWCRHLSGLDWFILAASLVHFWHPSVWGQRWHRMIQEFSCRFMPLREHPESSNTNPWYQMVWIKIQHRNEWLTTPTGNLTIVIIQVGTETDGQFRTVWHEHVLQCWDKGNQPQPRSQLIGSSCGSTFGRCQKLTVSHDSLTPGFMIWDATWYKIFCTDRFIHWY